MPTSSVTISDIDELSVVPGSDPIEDMVGSDVGGAQDVEAYYANFNWGAQPNVREQMVDPTYEANGKAT